MRRMNPLLGKRSLPDLMRDWTVFETSNALASSIAPVRLE